MSKINSAKEIKLSTIKSIISRTDLKGKIQYCNQYFTEISGYDEDELVGSAHNIIRHPDMPKVIFKLMWDRLQKHEDILAVVKNKTKSGDYYWVTTLFETKYHPFDNRAEGYLALRKAVSDNAIKTITPLYAKLLELEKEEGILASEKYFLKFLRDQNKTYDEWIKEVVEYKGLAVQFFNAMRKMFD